MPDADSQDTSRPTDSADHAEPSTSLGLRPGPILLAIGIVVGGSLYWWFDAGRHMFSPKNWGVVEEGVIYRSGQIHPWVIERTLRDQRIDVIVSLAADGAHPNEAGHGHGHGKGHGSEHGHGDHGDAHHDDEQHDDEHHDDHHHGDAHAGGHALDTGSEREVDAAKKLGIRRVNTKSLDGHGIGDLDDYLMALREIVGAKKRGDRVLVHCYGGSERTGATIAMYRMLYQGWAGTRAYEEYLSYRKDPPETQQLAAYVNKHLPAVARQLRSEGLLERTPQPLPLFGPK